jgi:hypothetical protein
MIQDAIRDRIEQFTSELEALVRQAAIESVTNALGGGAAVRTQVASAFKATPKAAVTSTSAGTMAPKLAFKRGKGGKRTPEQLAQIDASVLGFVKANPGNGVEHMAKTMGVASKDVASRVLLLIHGKKIRKTGQKRATKYFPV